MVIPKPLLYWTRSAPGGESKTTTQWDGNESQLEVAKKKFPKPPQLEASIIVGKRWPSKKLS
ncbi:hypothetical protein DAPPUDRAFT_235918 [Daphnia pulex]|uniref:Uncharacterized protein n=1 Tax=Daphnia pulex TaxID=6669 RepID=E9FZE5_DAPPU|nr:hypothetical protein DAPPUDRAFT_235918 [Daphnia pulex]|eukprot:EFX87038.1 hypothetical protein DAPPUDRAFT_235918 [Daphnia pulex]